MFFQAASIAGILVAIAAVIYRWRIAIIQRAAIDRLFETTEQKANADAALPNVARVSLGPLRRTWIWLPWGAGVALAIVLLLVLGWPAIFALSVGLIVGMLGAQLEAFFATRRAAKLETQLADSIDLMIGALGAGTGVLQALQTAIAESAQPVRGQLEEVVGRIRLGDDPQTVFRNLADRIPLESFLLFSSAMSVHWEVGGSLTPTLATVGRTIRDRIEVARRIQSNIAQSQLSTVFLMLLTYFIAAVVWRNNPLQMRAFLQTSIGQFFVSGSMLLQAVGMVWMSTISRVRF